MAKTCEYCANPEIGQKCTTKQKRFPYCTVCMDCGAVGEEYNVHSILWDSVVPADDKVVQRLCIGCLEKRLGRKLTPIDFT